MAKKTKKAVATELSEPAHTSSERPSLAPVSARAAVVPARLLGALIVFSFLLSLLAVYQWMELIVQANGGALSCSISEAMDCATVWGSKFAKAVQSATKMPIAGWGLVWGLTSFGTVTRLWLRQTGGAGVRPADVNAVRVVAAAGVLTSITLAIVTVTIGSVCVTCLTTYALVLGYAIASWRLPHKLEELGPAVGIAAAFTVVGYLALLYPGMNTPVAAAGHSVFGDKGPPGMAPAAPASPASPSAAPAAAPAAPQDPLAQYLATMPRGAQQLVADSLEAMRRAPIKDRSKWPPRYVSGPRDAPVIITDFISIRCPHCAQLAEGLGEMRGAAPPGSFAIEPHHYPLDSDCNPNVPGHDESGATCAAAKALICLEAKDAVLPVEEKLFKELETLTKARVIEVAAAAYGDRAQLELCMQSPDTKAKLDADIAFAQGYDIHGTPLVLINNRKATPVAPFLFAMILAGGNPKAAPFDKLPLPSTNSPFYEQDHPPH